MADLAERQKAFKQPGLHLAENRSFLVHACGSAAPGHLTPPMVLLEDLRVYVWYKLRRKTRRYRNRVAADVFARAVASLGPGDVCIDCGANVGGITRRLAATGATVHAFEPNPYAFEVLVEEMQEWPNVILHNVAVGVGNAPVKLYLGNHALTGSRVWGGATTVAGKANLGSEDYVLVEQVDFATFVREIGVPIAIIKIDIEGGELELLSDLLNNALQDSARHIFVETHEKQFPRLQKAMMELEHRCRPLSNIHLDWW